MAPRRDTPSVEHGGGRIGLSTGLFTAFDVERMMEPLQRPVVAPAIEVVVDRAAWWKVFGDGPPLTARAKNVHHPIDDFAQVDRALVATRLRRRNLRRNLRPFLVGQVMLVAQMASVVAAAVLFGPHSAPRKIGAADRLTADSSRASPWCKTLQRTPSVPGQTLMDCSARSIIAALINSSPTRTSSAN